MLPWSLRTRTLFRERDGRDPAHRVFTATDRIGGTVRRTPGSRRPPTHPSTSACARRAGQNAQRQSPSSVHWPWMPPWDWHQRWHPVGLQARSPSARGDATACEAPNASATADPTATSQRPIRPLIVIISILLV